MTTVVLIHIAATLFMTGVIWFVQIVHYPLMARVDRESFVEYERRHTRRTTWVVAPPMLIEVATALWLVARPVAGIPVVQTWVGLGLVLVVWILTATVQVPLHRRLERGFDGDAHRRLVRSNRLRTLAWSARSVLVLSWGRFPNPGFWDTLGS